ncbi:WbqC family protein [Streptomyces sirii]|uniref:WbqC family protein n=1 Tax=Streptomyces sirii TaxID=3127701 RepID=UPI003D362CB7
MIYIEQPPFAPWLGFCEALIGCDTVALYDSVQYTEGGYQNRNSIKTADGVQRITVPVARSTGQLIRDTRIAPTFDPDSMLRRIRLAYARSPHLDEALHVLGPVLGAGHTWLVDLNIDMITQIATALGARAQLMLTSEMKVFRADKTERLAAICAHVKEKALWAGSGTRKYLDTAALAGHGVEVVWNEFAGRHPTYAQTWPRQGFVPRLSVIDVVCALGWAGTATLLRTSFDTYLPHAERGAAA